MKKLFFLLFTMIVILGVGGVSYARVLNFDDLTTDSGLSSINSLDPNYGGMTWDSKFSIIDDATFQGGSGYYGNSYGSPSGEYAAFNNFGVLTLSLSGATFDFTGAYFAGWGHEDTSGVATATSIAVEGYNSGSLVDSIRMDLSADQYDWLQADIMNVDNLVFVSSGEYQLWLMDDLTLNESAPVPEPATMLLLGSGLIGLVGLRRRFKK